MVIGNVINACAVCEKELLTRAEVEALVSGKECLLLSRAHMRWDMYSSGGTFIFAEFGGVTGSKGETKNVVCGCNVVHAPTPALTMIREEFRDAVRAKFGDSFSVPFLFRIPAAMVAWENSAFVCYQPSPNGLRLSSEGTGLIEMIAEMSKLGLFRGGLEQYSQESIMTGFSYLHMVKPKYRSFVAVQFGDEVKIADFFAKVTLDWLDWGAMASLSCSVVDDMLHVYRVPGIPLVDTVFAELAKCNRSFREFVKSARPVSVGSNFTLNNSCFQVMPGSEALHGDPDEQGAFAVELREGHAFIPSGPVILRGSKLAVTFEPGVVLGVTGGIMLRAPRGAVTLFVDGVVAVDIQSQAIGVPEEKFSGFVRQYQVAVACESYGGNGTLAKWYKRRLDPTSTEARFFAATAAVVLLHYPSVDVRGRARMKLKIDEGADTGDGIRTHVCRSSDSLDSGCVITQKGVHTLSGVRVRYGAKQAVLCGSIVMTALSRIGLLSEGIIEFERWTEFEMSTFAFAGDPKVQVGFNVAVVADEYILDRGGPSDSEGFEDELSTYFPSKLSDALESYVWRGGYPKYTGIALYPGNMMRVLGHSATVSDVVAVDSDLVDEVKLQDTGWRRRRNGRWELVPLTQATVRWDKLTRLASSWGLEQRVNSLLSVLRQKYGMTAVVPCISSACE